MFFLLEEILSMPVAQNILAKLSRSTIVFPEQNKSSPVYENALEIVMANAFTVIFNIISPLKGSRKGFGQNNAGIIGK